MKTHQKPPSTRLDVRVLRIALAPVAGLALFLSGCDVAGVDPVSPAEPAEELVAFVRFDAERGASAVAVAPADRPEEFRPTAELPLQTTLPRFSPDKTSLLVLGSEDGNPLEGDRTVGLFDFGTGEVSFPFGPAFPDARSGPVERYVWGADGAGVFYDDEEPVSRVLSTSYRPLGADADAFTVEGVTPSALVGPDVLLGYSQSGVVLPRQDFKLVSVPGGEVEDLVNPVLDADSISVHSLDWNAERGELVVAGSRISRDPLLIESVLFLTDLEGGSFKLLAEAGEGLRDRDVRWGPGEDVLFVRAEEGERCGLLMTVDVETGEEGVYLRPEAVDADGLCFPDF